MSVPSLAEVEHADWPTLKGMAVHLGLNPKGRSAVVRTRVLDHVRRRAQPEAWRATSTHWAALLTRLGFPDPALRIWQSSVRLDAPAPWIGLGRAHLAAGDLTEAVKAFDRAAQMGDAAAHLARAETLAAEGKFEAALRACDAYLAARPGDIRGIALKASFVARAGWTEETAKLLRQLFEDHPQVLELWRGLGDVLLRGGRHEVAAEAFGEAVRANPSDAGSWTNRGVALLLAGRNREAIGAIREALELDPTHPEALNDLGVAYLESDQVKSAIVNLERAAKHLEHPLVVTNLAKAYEAGQMQSRAAAAFERAESLRSGTAAKPRRVSRARPRSRPRRETTKKRKAPAKGKRPRAPSGSTRRKPSTQREKSVPGPEEAAKPE